MVVKEQKWATPIMYKWWRDLVIRYFFVGRDMDWMTLHRKVITFVMVLLCGWPYPSLCPKSFMVHLMSLAHRDNVNVKLIWIYIPCCAKHIIMIIQSFRVVLSILLWSTYHYSKHWTAPFQIHEPSLEVNHVPTIALPNYQSGIVSIPPPMTICNTPRISFFQSHHVLLIVYSPHLY